MHFKLLFCTYSVVGGYYITLSQAISSFLNIYLLTTKQTIEQQSATTNTVSEFAILYDLSRSA